jgi:Tfp pilus assembly protein PilV
MKKRRKKPAKNNIVFGVLLIGIITVSFLAIAILQLQNNKQSQNSSLQAAGQVAWPVFDGDAQKSGANNNEPGITTTTVSSFKQIWQTGVSADGSPVYLSGVNTAQGVKNLVYITSKNGTLTAYDEATGKQVWSAATSGFSGTITSSPAIDPNHQFIYSYGKDGKVHKYAAGSGNEETTGGWPVTITLMPSVEKGSSAIAISNSYLYMVTSAYPGDNGQYVGHIVAKNLSSGAVTVFNSLCSSNKELINGTCSSRESGIWSRPGVVVDPASGNVFVSTGNGPYNPPNDLGDSVIELTPDLSSVVDTYTPSNQQQLNGNDQDLGSTSPVIVPGVGLVVQGGKDDTIRVLNIKNLSGQSAPYHIGGELQSLPVECNIFTQPISWVNGGTTWVFVTDQCNNLYGYKASTTGLQQVYKKSGSGGSSPLIVSGMLFIQSSGSIRAIDPATGGVLWSGAVGGRHWQSPAVINGHIFVIDNSNLTAFAVPNGNSPTSSSPPMQAISPTFTVIGDCTVNNNCPTGTTAAPTIGTNPSILPTANITLVVVSQALSQAPINNLTQTPEQPQQPGSQNLLQLLIQFILFILEFLIKLFNPIGH